MPPIFQLLSPFANLAPWAAGVALGFTGLVTMWIARLDPSRSRNNRERARFVKKGEKPQETFSKFRRKKKKIPGTGIFYSDLIPLTADEVIERVESGEPLGATLIVDNRGEVKLKEYSVPQAKEGSDSQNEEKLEPNSKRKGRVKLESTPQVFVPEDVQTELKLRIAARESELIHEERINDGLKEAIASLNQDIASLEQQNKPFFDLNWETANTKESVETNTEQLADSARFMRRSAIRLEELVAKDPRVQAVDREVAKRRERAALTGFNEKKAVEHQRRRQMDNRVATGDGAVASKRAERLGKARGFRDRTKNFLNELGPGGKSNRPNS